MGNEIKSGDSVRVLANGTAMKSATPDLWIVTLGQPGDDDYGDYGIWTSPEDLFPMELNSEKLQELIKLAEWLVSLDDPEGPGFEARRSVTMNAIIRRARAALGREEE